MSKTTQGPWTYSAEAHRTHNDPERFWEAYVVGEHGLVARACGATSEEAVANARLIAAVTDLLHFAKWSAQVCEGPIPLTPEQVVQNLPRVAAEVIAIATEAEGR